MHRDSRVSHDSLGSRGSDLNVAQASGLRCIRNRDGCATFHNLIPNEIQIPLLRLAYHLLVGNSRLRRRIPIDHPATAIDQALVVKLDKDSLDSGCISVIEGVALARPIA